jgi:hypothetical protein
MATRTPAQKRAATIARKKAVHVDTSSITSVSVEQIRAIAREELGRHVEQSPLLNASYGAAEQHQARMQVANNQQINIGVAPPSPWMQERTREMIAQLRDMVAVAAGLQVDLEVRTEQFRRPFAPSTSQTDGSSPGAPTTILQDLQNLANDLIYLSSRQRDLIETLS